MTESEIRALLDTHDALVKAYVDSSLRFSEFVSAYDGFPHNYALDGHEAATQEDRAILTRFRQRVAFHLRVSAIVSGVYSDAENTNPLFAEAGRFLPAVGLMRIRELVASHPDFRAEPAF
jgi:hypothetical protein